MVVSDCNPMTYMLSLQFLGERTLFFVILQEFDLELIKSKSKKSLIFAQLICDLHTPESEQNLVILFWTSRCFLSLHLTHGIKRLDLSKYHRVKKVFCHHLKCNGHKKS